MSAYQAAIEGLEERHLLSGGYGFQVIGGFPQSSTGAVLVNPIDSPVVDSSGNLFGVAESGGTAGNGGIFELAKGSHTMTDLASFPATVNGEQSLAIQASTVQGIVINSSGDIFGTADDERQVGCIFELPAGSHTIQITELSAPFNGVNGPPAIDSAGNIYDSGAGDIWELPAGASSPTLLATIPSGHGIDDGGLVVDGSGDVFGLTQEDIDPSLNIDEYGAFYELPAGSSTVNILDTISGYGNFVLPLTYDAANGNIYGISQGITSSEYNPVTGEPEGTVITVYPAIVEFAKGGGLPQTLVQLDASDGSTTIPGPLVCDSNGDLLGWSGGSFAATSDSNFDDGDFFELPAGGNTITPLVTFTVANSQTQLGENPGGFVQDAQGDILGYCEAANNEPYSSAYGNIYELTPGGSTGGGGSGGSSSLSATIARSTLPASVVAGGSSRGETIVDVGNTGSSTYTGTDTVDVYASTDGSVDSSSTLIGTVTRRVGIRAGRAAPVVVPIRSLPATLDGSYTLLAQVTDTAGNTAASTTGPTLTAAAPFVSFSETLVRTTLAPADVSGQKTRAAAQIKITNNGNIVSAGRSTIAFYASIDTTPTDGTLVRSVTEPIVLKPGASRVVTIPLLSLPSVANGNYYLDAQVIDPRSDVTSVVSSGVYALAAPFISLVPSAASVAVAKNGTATVTFTVTNGGNIAPSGLSTITIYASADGTTTNAAAAFTQRINLPLPPARSRLVRLKLTAAQVTTLQAAAATILAVTDPLGGVLTLTLTV